MARKTEFNMEALKSYTFWTCTPLGLAAAIVAAWMAIGAIADELSSQTTLLETQKTAIDTLQRGASTHPNQGTIDSINEKKELLADNVYAAWSAMVNDQREQNRWTGLAAAATRDIESQPFLGPLTGATLDNYLSFAQAEINRMLDRNFARSGEADLRLRRIQEFRRLPNGNVEPLERLSLADSSSRGGGDGFSRSRGGDSMGMGMSTGTSGRTATAADITFLRGTVVWDNPSLDITLKNWQQRPHAFEVWLTQEDLWVYQALLWVVAESNRYVREQTRMNTRGGQGGAGGMSAGSGTGTGTGLPPLNLRESVVKEIVDISIGQRAAMELFRQASRRITMGGMGGMGMGSGMGDSSGMGMGGGMGMGMFGGMSGMSGGMGDTSGMGMSGMSSGMGMGDSSGMGMSTGPTPEMLLAFAMRGRYVDEAGQPLMDPDLTEHIRRMPIYLRLVVNQRYISDVLVNCANCPMPINVLWVTINPDATQPFHFVASTGTSGGMGMGGSMGDSSGMGMGGSMGGMGSRPTRSRGDSFGGSSGGSGGRGFGRGSSNDVDFGPDAVTIEIFGSINIFAPPDAEQIRGTKVLDATTGTTSGTTGTMPARAR